MSTAGTRLLRLPASGALLVAADLRGNLRDFEQVLTRFAALGDTAHLLLLGNLVHGPYLPPAQFPASLGRYYRDESPAILLKLLLLQERAPGRVHVLLGNHEYAHLGGPRTSRFAEDEAEALRARLGREAAEHVEGMMARLPLWALAPCGLLLCHAAPRCSLTRLEDLERWTLADRERVGPLLWSPPLQPAALRPLLLLAGVNGVVYGHEAVRGTELIGTEQLVLASSFTQLDEDKRVLLLDLAARYPSVAALHAGREVLPLYE